MCFSLNYNFQMQIRECGMLCVSVLLLGIYNCKNNIGYKYKTVVLRSQALGSQTGACNPVEQHSTAMFKPLG